MDTKQKQLIAERWDESHEKQLKKVLSENEELRKVLSQSSEKMEMYKLKILESEQIEYPLPTKEICCRDCKFQLPPISIGGKITSRFNWGKCRIMDNKPYEVLYDGVKCEYYEKE